MSEETVIFTADQAGMDVGSAGCQDTGVSEKMPVQDSENVTVGESGSSNDPPSISADVVSEPEVTNVSSETSNSSQGLHDFHFSVHIFICMLLCICIE